MREDGKRTEVVSTKLTERMALDLHREAMHEDRSVSEFLFMLIRRELYGRTLRHRDSDGDLPEHTR